MSVVTEALASSFPAAVAVVAGGVFSLIRRRKVRRDVDEYLGWIAGQLEES